MGSDPEMFTHQVIEETSNRRLGELEFAREIQKDECVFHDGTVYRVRWMRIVAPASACRRELRAYETNDTCYLARLE
jgi:hypothetical protein